MDKHLKIMSLITAATLLLVSAVVVASMEAGLLGPMNLYGTRIYKAEVRAAEVQTEEPVTEVAKE